MSPVEFMQNHEKLGEAWGPCMYDHACIFDITRFKEIFPILQSHFGDIYYKRILWFITSLTVRF